MRIRKTIFGKSYHKSNTFIGGITAQVNTAAMLAFVLSPDLISSDIKNFKIIGTNISCYIKKRYAMRSDTFNPLATGNSGQWHTNFGNARTLTHFVDLDGKISSISDQNFLFQENCHFVFVPNTDYLAGVQGFRGMGGTCIYAYGAFNIIGGSQVNNGYFGQIVNPSTKIYLPASLQTSNLGSVDADVASAISQGYNVQFLSNSALPSDVQDRINLIIH